MTKKILVPVDFSEASGAALATVAQMARATDAKVELLHVVPDRVHETDPLDGHAAHDLGDLRSRTMDSAIHLLTSLTEKLEGLGVAAASHLGSGEPVATIAGRARELKADLIVATTHGRTGFDHFLMGSVCERLLRQTPCPVLVVRGATPDAAMTLKGIVVAVDCSPYSRRALDLALTMALSFGAKLEIVHVWEPPDFARNVQPDDALHQRLREEAKLRLDEFLQSAKLPVAFQSEPTLLAGTAAVALIRHLEAQGTDLVVLGTHGRAGIEHLLMGSVAETVTRYAPCSTLVVP